MKEAQATFEYDDQADVLYIGLGSDEMSVSHEVDENLVLDIGVHSQMLTGFRIIGPKAKSITVNVILTKIAPQAMKVAKTRAKERLAPLEHLKDRKQLLRKVLCET